MTLRVAVTGASGFVGGYVARALERQGMHVRGFGRRSSQALTHHVPNYASWDVTQGARHLDDVDVVVHCAAHVGQWGDAGAYHRTNVTGTEHVIASLGAGVRVIHVSSASVYHAEGTLGGVHTESDPIHAESLPAYARTKAASERIVLESGRGAVVLRPHIVYGPGDTTLWPRVMASVRRGRLLVPGTGRNRIAVTHVEHLAQAVAGAVRTTAATGIFNVADAESPTVHDLLRTMFARHHVPVRLSFMPRAFAWRAAQATELAWRMLRQGGEPPLTRYVVQNLADEFRLDITRARDQLGYAPTWTYRDGPLEEPLG